MFYAIDNESEELYAFSSEGAARDWQAESSESRFCVELPDLFEHGLLPTEALCEHGDMPGQCEQGSCWNSHVSAQAILKADIDLKRKSFENIERLSEYGVVAHAYGTVQADQEWVEGAVMLSLNQQKELIDRLEEFTPRYTFEAYDRDPCHPGAKRLPLLEGVEVRHGTPQDALAVAMGMAVLDGVDAKYLAPGDLYGVVIRDKIGNEIGSQSAVVPGTDGLERLREIVADTVEEV